MSYDIYFPCQPDKIVKITIEESLDLFFHDYDLEEELFNASLGYPPSPCVHLLGIFEEKPIVFLCSGIIPYNDMGLVIIEWLKKAYNHATKVKIYDYINDRMTPTNLEIYNDAYFLGLSAAKTFFTHNRYRGNDLYNAIDMLKELIFKSSSLMKSKVVSKDEVYAVKALIDLLSAILEIVHQEVTFGMVQDYPKEIYNSCSNKIVESLFISMNRIGYLGRDFNSKDVNYEDIKVDLLEMAIDVLGKLQK